MITITTHGVTLLNEPRIGEATRTKSGTFTGRTVETIVRREYGREAEVEYLGGTESFGDVIVAGRKVADFEIV